MTSRRKRLILNIILSLVGNFIYAFGVHVFCENNGLVTGGVTGISVALHYFTGVNTAYFAWGFNIIFFIIGFIVLGKRFALSTLASTILYPFFMFLLSFGNYDFFKTGELFISTICSGVLMGVGIGLVMRTGGSTGGLDVPVLILNKYLHMPVGLGITLFDILTLAIQLIIPSAIPDPQFVMLIYGFIMIIIYSICIDYTLLAGKKSIEIKILTNKKDEVSDFILNKMNRGLTYLHSKTGYLHVETDYILVVLDMRELPRFKDEILHIDPNAFVVISSVKEVAGRGFSKEKSYVVRSDEEAK